VQSASLGRDGIHLTRIHLDLRFYTTRPDPDEHRTHAVFAAHQSPISDLSLGNCQLSLSSLLRPPMRPPPHATCDTMMQGRGRRTGRCHPGGERPAAHVAHRHMRVLRTPCRHALVRMLPSTASHFFVIGMKLAIAAFSAAASLAAVSSGCRAGRTQLNAWNTGQNCSLNCSP
jgi:hypothetical protein